MIDVVMTTYCPEEGHVRGTYGAHVAASLNELDFPRDEKIRLVIANDGPAEQPHCADIAKSAPSCVNDVLVVGGNRKGIGGSLNRALEHVSDLWLYITDDWKAGYFYDTGPANVEKAVKLLRLAGYDYVRLGPPHPNIDCTIMFRQDIGWWLRFHTQQQTSYAFATRPFLATKSFYNQIGRFKEECDAYVCERDYGDRVNHIHGPLMGEVASYDLQGGWEHIGVAEVGDKYP